MSDCIIWTGLIWAGGRYGVDKLNGKNIGAHRAAWIRENGDIPAGLIVCHKCDNGLCVNVDHLFLGTHSDNMQDCIKKGRFKFNTDNQKGANNSHARKDYNEILKSAKQMWSEGKTYRYIRAQLNIKSNGHLRQLLLS